MQVYILSLINNVVYFSTTGSNYQFPHEIGMASAGYNDGRAMPALPCIRCSPSDSLRVRCAKAMEVP
jgi:hypothetical protein